MTDCIRLVFVISFFLFDVLQAQIPLSNSMGHAFFNAPDVTLLTSAHADDGSSQSCRVGGACTQCSQWYNEKDVCETDKELPIYYCNSQG